MTIGVEERAYGREVGHEEEVYQVDVERATTNILQRPSYPRHFCKVLMVEPEVHEHDGQQNELRHCQRQVGPLHPERMPFQGIEGADDDNADDEWEEPL